MADHFLQLFAVGQLELLKPLIHPFGEHPVQHLGLLAGLVAHAHGVIHDNDGQHRRNGEDRGIDAAVPPRGNDHGADRGRVGAGHAARTPHTLGNKAVEDKKIQKNLNKLGQQRCTDRRSQHKIPTQRSAQQWHGITSLFLTFQQLRCHQAQKICPGAKRVQRGQRCGIVALGFLVCAL